MEKQRKVSFYMLFSFKLLSFYSVKYGQPFTCFNLFQKTYTVFDQDHLLNALNDIGDDFSELNAGSDSDSDENSNNEPDNSDISNTEVTFHEEKDEPEVILIRPRTTY